MISKTQISKRVKKKRNPELVRTIESAKKKNFLELGKRLSGPTRLQSRINLNQLSRLKETKIIVAGKVLGQGDINKKISISALGFSEQAREKLKKAGCEIKTILEEIKTLKDLKGVTLI
jgi:large subunit ribosomal protein L18e